MERITIADLVDPTPHVERLKEEVENARQDELSRTSSKETPRSGGQESQNALGTNTEAPAKPNGRWPTDTWFQKRRRAVAFREIVQQRSVSQTIREIGRLSGDWRIK